MAAVLRSGGAAVPRVGFASARFDMRPLAELLRTARPDWQVRVWPEPGWEAADVAVCWDTPAGLYAQMPRLRLVHGIAAGVDNIVREDMRGVPVCRVVDAQQVQGMVEYVLWSVLYFHRAFDQVLRQQRQGQWLRPVLRPAAALCVGVAGLGAMGLAVARALVAQGYRVRGFSRTPRTLEGVDCFAGDAQWPAFLGALDLLVCALPLTACTRGILARPVFEALPRGAALVHVGRGEQLHTGDLREALASGQLRGAVVDVFPQEPLAADDALWATPGLVATPHMATMASPQAIVQQIAANVERLLCGAPLQGLVAAH